MICYYKGLEETNAHKTELWIKSVERNTYIKQRAKPLPTNTTNQDKISSDDEDIIDKRRKNAHIWLFIDEALLVHDTCVGEDAVIDLKKEAAMKHFLQIEANRKKTASVFNKTKNKMPEFTIMTDPTIICGEEKYMPSYSLGEKQVC
jgi:hypothetical protein